MARSHCPFLLVLSGLVLRGPYTLADYAVRLGMAVGRSPGD